MVAAKVPDADTPDTFPFGGIREGSAMDALKKLIGVIGFVVGVWLIIAVAVDQQSVLVQTFHELGFSGWWAGLIFWVWFPSTLPILALAALVKHPWPFLGNIILMFIGYAIVYAAYTVWHTKERVAQLRAVSR
jgi:uncharacterized membrane protein YhaH (DUF805 family)